MNVEPLDDFTDALLVAYWTGDESKLRKIPEGRKYLLGLAKERRKEPLWMRMLPREMGKHAAETIDKIRLEVLTK